MENGEHKVEDFDKDVVGDGNGGAESVSVTVEVEGSVDGRKDEKEENGGDPVDEGQVVVDENGETETVVEKASVDPVEEVVSLEVNGGERMSDSTTVELPVVIENDKSNEPTDFEEPEVRTNEEGTTSGSTVGNQSSGFEASEATNDGFSETKGIDSVQAIDGESTSDKSAGDETSELETDGGEKDEAKRAGANDEQKIHIDVSRDESDMLENNGVKDNGIKEVGHVSNADVLEDVKDVNKKPVTLVLEASENGVSDHVDSDETVIREDGVNGDSVSCEIQLDGEIGVEANGDVNEKDTLVTESKDDDNVKLKEKFETSNNNLLNVQNGSTVEHVQEEEPKTFDPLSEHQDDKKVKEGTKQDMPVKKEPESRPVVGVSLSTSKSATPKHDSKPNQSPIPNSKPTTAPAPVAAPSTTSTRPAGLGSGAPLLEPAHRVVQSQRSGTASLQNQVIEEPTNGEADENDDTREKLQMIRVKFLRLARRLGQTPHNVVVAQVLYRLGLAEQIRGSNAGRVAAFSFERASAMAEQLEAAGQEPLEFSCTIMVLGKTGVGKSATINSIFDEVKFETSAFQHGTKKVQDVVGTVQGIKVRVIDTPGLLPSWADQRKNEKILHSVKRFIQKSPPDIVLYLDRLDMQSRDSGDMPLLRTITDIFGQSIWFNAIVVLTHAASAPPEGANGTATSYDMFVTQRSHVVQQAIRQAAGDMRLMNPVSLVENHSACRTNPAGQRVLPNGQVWKPHLLLLSFASKILVEANMLLKLQDSPPGKPFAARTRAPPLPYILSNLLQSRPQLKLPQEQFGDDDEDGDDDIDESSDEESSEYDELPPFKRLTNSQLSKLSKAQKKAYYDELEYREKLFMKKQLKEEKKRRKMMKKMAEEAKNYPSDITDNNNVEEDSSGAATVPVAVQDMTLPTSFDADNPTHRYRALDTANQWLTRPVLDPHGWDHDVGYEGINVEHLLAVKDKIPVSFSGQITKDKKDANLQMEVSSALKHGKSNSTTVAFDMQTVGKELSYTLRSETRFINYRKNKASAGISATYFGDSLTGGVKFEDKLMINKRGQLVVAGGAVIGRGDVAYGGSLEATLRDKDYPLGRFLSTIGLSVMDWHGDLALGWNAQSQIPIGRFTNLIGRVNLNNKGSGQVSVRLNSSEQLQIALTALVPLVSKLLGYYQDRDSAY
ncbi:putative small monomeric GTPase [Helianthus annuus]|nr:putative small monomeric GTPase [Helianthus annuus]